MAADERQQILEVLNSAITYARTLKLMSFAICIGEVGVDNREDLATLYTHACDAVAWLEARRLIEMSPAELEKTAPQGVPLH